jgi:hypothetical protein
MWELSGRREAVLIGPFSRVTPSAFPADIPASIYAHLNDARGRYTIGLQLVDSDGEVVWQWDHSVVVEHEDPLLPHRVRLQGIPLRFPAPGRFDLLLLANGQAVAQHALWARQAADRSPG